MSYTRHPDNQALKDFLKLKRISQKEFADIMKVKPQMISAVMTDKSGLTKDMVLYIINQSPEIATIYGFLETKESSVTEPKIEYETKLNSKKIEKIELEIGLLISTIMDLKDEVKSLKSEIQNSSK